MIYGFATHLPHDSTISMLQWIKIAYDAIIRIPKFNPFSLSADNRSIHGFNLSFLFSRTDVFEEAMMYLSKWIETGELKVSKVTEYHFDEVQKAHSDIQGGNTIGKLVLVTNNYCSKVHKH